MSLSREVRESAKYYLLELISRKESDIVNRTTDAFSVSKVTVYKYLNDLTEQGILDKDGREYTLHRIIDHTYKYKTADVISEDAIYINDLRSDLDGISDNSIGIWEYAISEMINNVIEHSESKDFYVQIIRDYLNTTVIIRDRGIGIFKKIADYYKFSSLDYAVEELFKGKLTTSAENHSGEGIFFTSRVMDLFAAFSSGKCFTHNKFSDLIIQDEGELIDQGTLVFMRLANNTNKTLRSVFDEYADVDGGFTRTRIPLRNIFETFPVSRSQAKRLSKRFEDFEEVVLDFEDISDMGQGFAHELFTLYAAKHPEVKLIPINTNESVQRMIYHVTH